MSWATSLAARGGRNVFERLRRLRVKTDGGDVLGKHRDEREAEALVEIGDELVARHFFERAIVAGAMFVGQVPVHVGGVPPGVVKSLPEEASLADAADFV